MSAITYKVNIYNFWVNTIFAPSFDVEPAEVHLLPFIQ